MILSFKTFLFLVLASDAFIFTILTFDTLIFPILTLFPSVAWPEHPGTASEKSKNKNVVQNAQYET